ncbi:hypothetical protein MPSYJ_03700 [Mycolicibacterium psychrotolerans]|uniref:Uncharacterized protein n=1 Tax=Mycolicibacterium psychrotolerans TaxID=216929 RepID=A0A7I7M6B1_9MYCO|nr:hypothetical protein MPSYJ_03700 [Mycolicibacterium psychrotolerans]
MVEVPNRRGPASVTHAPGQRVACVCTHDAVRVLQRSTAVPVARSGVGPQSRLAVGSRLSSRSAKRIAMS